MVIILDTFPLSSVAKAPNDKPTVSDQCHDWVKACEAAGHTVLAPAICYYEALREMEQRQATVQIARLKAFCLLPTRFIPITTAHLELAARLWGEARRGGLPTASPQALDGDAILAAQARSLGLAASEYIIASTNVGHLARFVPADEWINIRP